jgi:hypothetical protein
MFMHKHPSRQRQHAPKDNVADDTAEVGSERLQGPVGALERLIPGDEILTG